MIEVVCEVSACPYNFEKLCGRQLVRIGVNGGCRQLYLKDGKPSPRANEVEENAKRDIEGYEVAAEQ